jgi:hypothetical protein
LSDFSLDLDRHAARFLAPGERLLEAVRAMPVGPFGGSLGVFSGAVVGAVVHSVSVSRSVKKAAISRFPMAGRMVIGLTDHRVLVWRRAGARGNTVTELLGEIPLWRIASLAADRIPGRCMLTFVFRDAHPVIVETDKRDASERFVDAFAQCAAAEIAQPSLQPAAAVGGKDQPAQVQEKQAEGPTPPLVATGLAARGDTECPMCGARNPSTSIFCWRCLTLL